MIIRVPSRIIETDLTSAQTRTYLFILAEAQIGDGYLDMTFGALAKRLGFATKATILTAKRALQKAGLVETAVVGRGRTRYTRWTPAPLWRETRARTDQA